MIIHGKPEQIGTEWCNTFEECTARSHEIQLDYKKKDIYNVIIECRKVVK